MDNYAVRGRKIHELWNYWKDCGKGNWTRKGSGEDHFSSLSSKIWKLTGILT